MLSTSYLAFTSSIPFVSIPHYVSDALKQTLWKEAMIEQMKALDKIGTWDIV